MPGIAGRKKRLQIPYGFRSEKISKAKQLMNDGSLKLYEIADKLGFENSFYFSKVFKKVEGCSPRDYIQGRVKIR
ncbi:MAG: helix-turn-helix domain-containing protein [Anaerocolumna sp.]